MKIENLRNILTEFNNQEKNKTFENLKTQYSPNELFQNLYLLLDDKESQVRFFSLDYIIKNFNLLLSQADQKLTDKIYDLIFDENATVADRAVWAIGITGDIGLNKLITHYQTSCDSIKATLVLAIGRSNFKHKIASRIDILLDAIESEDENVSFNAMCELMSNSPAGSWKRNQENAIYFEKVYATVIPIAKKFSKSNSTKFSEFANRYLKQLGNK